MEITVYSLVKKLAGTLENYGIILNFIWKKKIFKNRVRNILKKVFKAKVLKELSI